MAEVQPVAGADLNHSARETGQQLAAVLRLLALFSAGEARIDARKKGVPYGLRHAVLAAAHQAGDGAHQLIGHLFWVAVLATDDAVLSVVVEQPKRHLVERGLDGGDLSDDLDAVALVINHPLHAANLALDPPEALQQLVLGS